MEKKSHHCFCVCRETGGDVRELMLVIHIVS